MLDAIYLELMDAKEKWPEWPVDPIHAASVLSEETGELVQACNDFCYSDGPVQRMREEAIQVAAMAIRFLEGMESYTRVKGY